MGEVRIIAGIWRGRKLQVLSVPGLRPTGDRVRETLFNWLMSILPGAHCLDLCAGSGALGFEAISRGAESVVMLERHPQVFKNLQAQQQKLKADAVTLMQMDALTWVSSQKTLPFDIIFLDPPFQSTLVESLLGALAQKTFGSKTVWLFVESPKGKAVDVSQFFKTATRLKHLVTSQVEADLWQI